MAGLGLWFAKRNTTTEQYFLGDRSFPGWAIGLSMLSGAHMTLAPWVVEEVRKRGSEIPVILGGIVPDHDLDALREAGITTVLTPGATAEQIANEVAAALAD